MLLLLLFLLLLLLWRRFSLHNISIVVSFSRCDFAYEAVGSGRGLGGRRKEGRRERKRECEGWKVRRRRQGGNVFDEG